MAGCPPVRATAGRVDVRPGYQPAGRVRAFALAGPAIGATSVSPDMSVTRPATLTATAVAEAAEAGHASILFASPAALRNVVATADRLSADQRFVLGRIDLVLSAGAPVHPQLMAQVARISPAAEIHSPYGMTEALLLADIDVHPSSGWPRPPAPSETACAGPAVVRCASPSPRCWPTARPGTNCWRVRRAGLLGESSFRPAPEGRVRRSGSPTRSAAVHRDSLEWPRTHDIGHLATRDAWIEGRRSTWSPLRTDRWPPVGPRRG